MSLTREAFLKAADDGDQAGFLSIMENNGSSDGLDLSELIPSLNKKQMDELWLGLHQMCTSVLLGLCPSDEDGEGNTEEQQEELNKTDAVLQGIVSVAMTTVTMEKPVIPELLFECAVVLHGILLTLPETQDKLKNSIAKLCEAWWSAELQGKDELAPQTIIYLLEKTLASKVLVVDVKRVWNLRSALKLMDFENQSSDYLKNLLENCMMHASFVKNEKGRRFLSYLFGINVNFIENLHKTIKNQLPYCASGMLEWYGEIYFLAWRVASGTYLEKIETYCVQDLMYHGVHAQRGPGKSLASSLRKLLGYFHKQKKQHGVDEMLLRLYGPIIWRSLKVANGCVRANALALLCDVFPLQDPDANVDEIDQLMQKQFDILASLLVDPCPAVRVVAVQGVCRICNVFWEMIPPATTKAFIIKLVQELANDSGSSDVRVAVFMGLAYLLDNHLSHPLMKTLLPTLGNFLHDDSEKVRVTFIDLLLKVKGIRAIKFWAITPVEHLLVRLESDTAPVARRIVSLLYNSFMPVEKPGDVQVMRCLTLIRTNPGAARRFYQYTHSRMSVENTARFMVLLCRCVVECARRENPQNAADFTNLTNTTVTADEEEKENEGQDENELSLQDTDAMAGFFETIAILWAGISHSLNKPGHKELKLKMQHKFSQVLPEFLRLFPDPRCTSALVLIAGHLPPGNIAVYSQGCLSRLRNLTMESTAAEYGVLIETMCNWGRVRDILDLASDWLNSGLTPAEQPEGKSKNAKKGKSVKFTEPAHPQPHLALEFLSYLLRQPVCREMVLQDHKPQLRQITNQLKGVQKCIEERFTSAGPISALCTDEFLVESCSLYCRLEILLHEPESKELGAVAAFEQLLTWADKELLSAMVKRETPSGGKRSADDVQANVITDLAHQLVEIMMKVFCDLLLVGIGDKELASHLADFTASLLEMEGCVKYLPLIMRLIYHIVEQTSSVENDEGVGSHMDIIPGLISKVLQILAKSVKNSEEQGTKVLASVRLSMTDVMQSYYRGQSLHEAVDREFMSNVMAAVVADMTHQVKKDPDLEACDAVAQLPTVSAFLLGIITKKKLMTSLFIRELCECIKAGVLEGILAPLAALHVVNTVSRGKFTLGEVKDCLIALQPLIEQYQPPQVEGVDESYYDTERGQQGVALRLLKDCMTHVGMVV